jgi:hypothetical protein
MVSKQLVYYICGIHYVLLADVLCFLEMDSEAAYYSSTTML